MPPRVRDLRAKDRGGVKATFVFVAGEAVRAARLRVPWTIEQLGQKANVTERTIGRIENGNAPKARRDTVEFLADALQVGFETLVTKVASPLLAQVPAKKKKRSIAAPTHRRLAPEETVARSKERRRPTLDELVASEPPADPPIASRRAAPQRMTARAFQYVIAAFLGYEGVRFVVRGKLTRQCGLRRADAEAIESEAGAGVYFLIQVPTPLGWPLEITVHTIDLPTTMAMQKKMDREVEVETVVRVARGGEDFAGLRWLGTTKLFFWTFVVRKVAAVRAPVKKVAAKKGRGKNVAAKGRAKKAAARKT